MQSPTSGDVVVVRLVLFMLPVLETIEVTLRKLALGIEKLSTSPTVMV